MAPRDRDGVRVGRGGPVHHRLRLRRYLVHRSGTPHPRAAVQAGRVHHGGRGIFGEFINKNFIFMHDA